MIKINKWFDEDIINCYKDEVVKEVIKKTNVKYGSDNIKYINFGNTDMYSINVEELLTSKLNELRTKYKGLDLYMYLCRLKKYKGKTKIDFIEYLYMWDTTVKKEEGKCIIHLRGKDITIDPETSNREEFKNLREYVIDQIKNYDRDIYEELINSFSNYYKTKNDFDALLDYIDESLSECLCEKDEKFDAASKYASQPYIIHYDKINAEMRNKLLSSLGISVCPYCNRQYITMWHDEEADDEEDHSTADLDHFYIKSDYPLFALSLFNFIPSCQICNSRFKGGKVRNTLYPYEEEFGRNIQFQLELEGQTPNEELQLKKWLGAVNASSDKLKLSLTHVPESDRDDFSLKVDGSKKLFRLDEVYDCHKGKAVEVVLKKRIYLEGAYKKYVDDFLEKSDIPSISLEKFLLGYDWNDDNFDEPLSKMTYDIFHSSK